MARRSGWLYVLTDPARPGLCKIGRSAQMWSRLSAARTFAPEIRDVATFAVADAVKAETAVRSLLSRSRIPGTEWHRCTKSVACSACALVAIHGGDRASFGRESAAFLAILRVPLVDRRRPAAVTTPDDAPPPLPCLVPPATFFAAPLQARDDRAPLTADDRPFVYSKYFRQPTASAVVVYSRYFTKQKIQ